MTSRVPYKKCVMDFKSYIHWFYNEKQIKDFVNFLKTFIISNIIDNVCYFRIYKDNSCFMSTTHPFWLEVFLQKHNEFEDTLFSKKLHQTLERDYDDIYAQWQYDKKDKLLNFNYQYGICLGFDIYIKHQNYIEVLSFDGNNFCTSFPDFCINNIKNFYNNLTLIRKELKKLQYNRCFTPIKLDFSLENPHKKVININFTEREVECIAFLKKGLSAKAIGMELGSSPRTIEYHIINIKKKLGIVYKDDLIKKLANFTDNFYEHKMIARVK